jgi:murein DD-endopeptidase MepM/ murein hydrolase activator NlpD
MMVLNGISGFALLFLQHLLWVPAPIQSLNVTSPITVANEVTGANGGKTAEEKNSDPLLGLERITHRIRPGDTLGKLFKPFGLTRQEELLWVRSIRKHFSPKRLRPGRGIYFYLDDKEPVQQEGNIKKQLKALEVEQDDDWLLTWVLGELEISFRKHERPYEIETQTIGGPITDSLYESGTRLGLSPKIVSQFADIYGWDVNFQTDIRSGDSFRVLFERRYRTEGKKKELFRILATQLTMGNEKHFAFYFDGGDGKGDYYDLEGKSLTRTFLRFPVEFSRISSTYSDRRLHPILKVRRAHRGVDFVAPRKTPVRAIGDGKVVYAGWKRGGYGRFIQIQHTSIYTSRYAHLNGYAPGLRRGKRVKKGQIIGYVGCSGRCTGSHLHFEMHKNQRYVNPLKIQLPREDRIKPPLREVFENAKQLVLTQLVSGSPSRNPN